MASEWTFAVTFESETQQPETIRGEVAGSLSAGRRSSGAPGEAAKPTKNHSSPWWC